MNKKPIFAAVPETDALAARAIAFLDSLLIAEEEDLVVPGAAARGEHAARPHWVADIILSDLHDDGALCLCLSPGHRNARAPRPLKIRVIADGSVQPDRPPDAAGQAGPPLTRAALREWLGLDAPQKVRVEDIARSLSPPKLPLLAVRQWYPILLLLMVGRRPRLSDILPRRALRHAPPSPDRQATIQSGADALANLYGSKYRSAFVGRFVLSAIVSVFAAVTIVAVPDARIYAFGAEFLATLTIVASFNASTKGNWQGKWLGYRFVAENLRTIRALPKASGQFLLCQRSFPDDPCTDEERLVDWCAREALAQTLQKPPPPVQQRRRALEDLLDQQLSYQRDRQRNQSLLEKRMAFLGLLAFSGAMLISFMAITFGVLLPDVLIGLENPLSVSLTVLPALGAALFAIRIQANFQSEAQQADLMTARLVRLQARFKAQDPDAETVDAFAQDLAGLLRTEFVDWRQVQQGRGMALPS